MCLICNAIVSVKKVYNIKRHYDTKHAKMYVRTEAENNVRASFEVSRLIASRLKPFTDGEFVKDCLLAVVDVVYPEKKPLRSRQFVRESGHAPYRGSRS